MHIPQTEFKPSQPFNIAWPSPKQTPSFVHIYLRLSHIHTFLLQLFTAPHTMALVVLVNSQFIDMAITECKIFLIAKKGAYFVDVLFIKILFVGACPFNFLLFHYYN